MTKTILVTGGGGVGKTTLSAAIGAVAAAAGMRTLVITVDPARRLADALGHDLTEVPAPHPEQPLLWAAMLDSDASWKAIARRHASPDVAERLVNNEFFEAAAQHFPASQSYAAAEEMANFIEARAWDVLVVDTPPSSGGIDFFRAPADMAELVGGRLLRWMTGASIPGRRLFFNRAAKPALRVMDHVLGANLFERVAAFLMALRTTYDGLSERAKEIDRYLAAAITLVVTTAHHAPLAEAERFFSDASVPRPRAVIFNRSLPPAWADHQPDKGDPLGDNFRRWAVEAHRQSNARIEFQSRHTIPILTIGWAQRPPSDLAGLVGLLEQGFDLDSVLAGWPED